MNAVGTFRATNQQNYYSYIKRHIATTKVTDKPLYVSLICYNKQHVDLTNIWPQWFLRVVASN